MIEPAEIASVDAADVYQGGILAGRLRRRPDHVEFDYDPSYRRGGYRGVASTLPVRDEPYITAGGSVPAFFAGLLPEGVRLQAVVRAVKTSLDDELSLLLAVGGDTVGNVTVVPVGERPRDPGEGSGVSDPGGVSFRELFARSVAVSDPQLDTALPGVQDKLSDGLISFPAAIGGGPAILKLTPPLYPRLVENEAFFLGMAEGCGFLVPPHKVVEDRDGVSGLLVERFDRVREGERVVRLAQEDVCQMAGRWPADKYRLSLRQAAGAVTAVASAPKPAALEVFRLAVFSYLIANGDMHAKNISVRWLPAQQMVAPTPVYDLISTSPYIPNDLQALHVDGRLNRIRGSDWIRFAESLGLPPRLAARKIAALCDKAAVWIERTSDIGFDLPVTNRLRATMEDRLEELRR